MISVTLVSFQPFYSLPNCDGRLSTASVSPTVMGGQRRLADSTGSFVYSSVRTDIATLVVPVRGFDVISSHSD